MIRAPHWVRIGSRQRSAPRFYVSSEIQSFSLAPTDTEVVEGRDIILHCQVSNQVGNVQWSFDPSIPGFPRYKLVGNSTLGEYDLKIINATLEDDDDFECQVGPAEGQDAVVAKAHLAVLLPPTSIQIVNKANGSVVQVKVSDRLSMECEVKGGKPAPKVIWTRNSFKLPEAIDGNQSVNRGLSTQECFELLEQIDSDISGKGSKNEDVRVENVNSLNTSSSKNGSSDAAEHFSNMTFSVICK
ncbi:uncharacterized protein TNCV_4152361 [Trichonephila clavipes]|nr:uncharacterized protein TNCV_4152361 [Trichonephila clavipes]